MKIMSNNWQIRDFITNSLGETLMHVKDTINSWNFEGYQNIQYSSFLTVYLHKEILRSFQYIVQNTFFTKIFKR